MQHQHKENDSTTSHQPWWRETQDEVVKPPIVEATAKSDELELPEARDIGEELEEEARQRALLIGQETTIPLSVVSTLRKSRQRFHRIHFPIAAFVMIVAIALMVFAHTSFLMPGASILCVEFLALYCYLLHNEKHARDSQVTLSRTGIHLTVGKQEYGPIFWEEISKIDTFRFCKVDFIGIRFKNTKALAKRLGGTEGKRLQSADRIIRIYKVFGSGVAPLNINVSSLPMTADAFMAQVAAVNSGVNVNNNSLEQSKTVVEPLLPHIFRWAFTILMTIVIFIAMFMIGTCIPA